MCVWFSVLVLCWIPAVGNLYEYSMLEIMTVGLYYPLGVMYSEEGWLAY